MIRGLSIEDFQNPGLRFHPNGRITPIDRPGQAGGVFLDGSKAQRSEP
jgi:hypothetical protein